MKKNRVWYLSTATLCKFAFKFEIFYEYECAQYNEWTIGKLKGKNRQLGALSTEFREVWINALGMENTVQGGI